MGIGRYHKTNSVVSWKHYSKLRRLCSKFLIEKAKLHRLNYQIDQIKLMPSQIIHEGNYLIKLTQHLHYYSPSLCKFANRLASSIQSQDLNINCKVTNIQLFEAYPFDNPESSSAQINQFQIQYQIIPHKTLVCWIPLDMDPNAIYSLISTPLIESTCPKRSSNENFRVGQGIRGHTIMTQNLPLISSSKDKVIQLKPGQILVQSEACGPNQISSEVVPGQTYRMLAVSLSIICLAPLISKL
jgi:hypothetical protein